jgi:hypothetical protein
VKTRGQELAERFVAVAANRDELAAAIDAAIKAAVRTTYDQAVRALERSDL